jgi:hypothetical protein
LEALSKGFEEVFLETRREEVVLMEAVQTSFVTIFVTVEDLRGSAAFLK